VDADTYVIGGKIGGPGEADRMFPCYEVSCSWLEGERTKHRDPVTISSITGQGERERKRELMSSLSCLRWDDKN